MHVLVEKDELTDELIPGFRLALSELFGLAGVAE
jgi:hypothetical protein